jgi:hypothetical protein
MLGWLLVQYHLGGVGHSCFFGFALGSDEHTMGVLALFLRFCSLLGFGEHVMLDICSGFVIGGVSIGSPLVDKHAIISIIWFAHW